MRWIATTIGAKAHVVMTGQERTLCGIEVVHARGIVTPGVDDRCENCDHLWRREGKSLIRWGKKQKKPTPAVYRPRFRYRDWERQ